MSATLDADLFRSFFGGAPLVTVPGRTFPVATYHLEDILEATNHIIEEHSRYALRQYDARETVSMWVSTKGGERKRQTVSLDSELGTNVSDRYPGFALPTRRSMDRVDESQINYDLIEDLLEFVLLKNGTTQALSPPEGVDISNGALLIFLPGVGEIKALSERLRSSRMFGDARWFTIVPLHSLLSSAEQRRAFEKPLNGRRNIILSTNIAETSVTIPDVVCVLDSGRVREVHYEKRTATRKLVATWCSKASAKQRAGRAGRVQPGLCLKLFSSLTEQNNMRLATEPEIRRIPLEEVCLNILASGFAVKCSDFLSLTPEPPDPDNVNAALQVLQNIKALTYSDSTLSERLTPLGNHLSRLPVDVRLGKMMVFGTLFRCIDTIATIVAALSASKSPFVMSLQDAHQAKAAHSSFHHPKSDFLTLLNVWEAFNKCDTQSKSRQFCQDNFLSFAVLREMGDARIQYLELLVGIGLLDRVKAGYDNQSRRFDSRLSAKSQYNRNGRKESIVHTVICAGLYPNVARVHLTPQGDQTIWHKQERLFVHSSSVNAKASRQLPICWMGYHEKFGTGNRVSISTTFFVHPLALLLFGGEIVVLHPQKKVTIDGWMELSLAAKTGVMFIQLRKQIDSILSTLIDCTDKKILESEAAESMVDGIVSLLS
jgi:HrpA-like RNA helicase